MILFFSGTGNSKFIAERLAKCPKAAIEYGNKTLGKERYLFSKDIEKMTGGN